MKPSCKRLRHWRSMGYAVRRDPGIYRRAPSSS
jgi:hypothetical protein